MPAERRAVSGWLAAGLLLAVALLERLPLWLAYPPASYSDTGGYRFLAGRILDGWKDYNGERLPGYPLFMALLGPDSRVYLAQLLLGVLMTLILFYIGYRASGRIWFGVLVGLSHTLNLGQLFFEADLLSESLTTFWILLTVLGVFVWLKWPARRSLFLAVGMGAAAGMAGLTRPLFVFLPFWVALFLALVSSWPGKLRLSWMALIGVTLPGLLILGAWVNYIHSRFGMWNLSTMTGYQLMQHTGYFFEYVPDQYAALRDTYLQYRDARIAQYGTQGNAIWPAIPAMMQASGLGFTTLSQLLTKISVQLIWEHPGLYLRNVLEGWWMFWRAPAYWQPDVFAQPWRGILEALVNLQHFALIGANLLFLATSFLALVWSRLRRLWGVDAFMTFIASTVWVTSILQTLPDHGDNPRFLVPMQSLVVLWVVWVAVHWIGQRYAPARFRPEI